MESDLTVPRDLTPMEMYELREMLNALLLIDTPDNDDEEDAENLIEYAIDMIENRETIQHIVEELEFMEMSMCDAEVASNLGFVLTQFFREVRSNTSNTTAAGGADGADTEEAVLMGEGEGEVVAAPPQAKSWTEELFMKASSQKLEPEQVHESDGTKSFANQLMERASQKKEYESPTHKNRPSLHENGELPEEEEEEGEHDDVELELKHQQHHHHQQQPTSNTTTTASSVSVSSSLSPSSKRTLSSWIKASNAPMKENDTRDVNESPEIKKPRSEQLPAGTNREKPLMPSWRASSGKKSSWFVPDTKENTRNYDFSEEEKDVEEEGESSSAIERPREVPQPEAFSGGTSWVAPKENANDELGESLEITSAQGEQAGPLTPGRLATSGGKGWIAPKLIAVDDVQVSSEITSPRGELPAEPLTPGRLATSGGESWIAPKEDANDELEESSEIEKMREEQPAGSLTPGRLPTSGGKSWITSKNNTPDGSNNESRENKEPQEESHHGPLTPSGRVSFSVGKSWITSKNSTDDSDESPKKTMSPRDEPLREQETEEEDFAKKYSLHKHELSKKKILQPQTSEQQPQNQEQPQEQGQKPGRISLKQRLAAYEEGTSSKKVIHGEEEEEGQANEDVAPSKKNITNEENSSKPHFKQEPEQEQPQQAQGQKPCRLSLKQRLAAYEEGASYKKTIHGEEEDEGKTNEDDTPSKESTTNEESSKSQHFKQEQEQAQPQQGQKPTRLSLKQRLAAYEEGASPEKKNPQKEHQEQNKENDKSLKESVLNQSSRAISPQNIASYPPGRVSSSGRSSWITPKNTTGELKQKTLQEEEPEQEPGHEVSEEEMTSQKLELKPKRNRVSLKQRLAAYEEGASSTSEKKSPEQEKKDYEQDRAASVTSRPVRTPSSRQKTWAVPKQNTFTPTDEHSFRKMRSQTPETEQEAKQELQAQKLISLKQRLAAYQGASNWKMLREQVLNKDKPLKDSTKEDTKEIADAPPAQMSLKERMAAFQGGASSKSFAEGEDVSTAASVKEDCEIDDTPMSMKDRLAAFQHGASKSMALVEEGEGKQSTVKGRISVFNPPEEKRNSLQDRMAVFGQSMSKLEPSKKETTDVQQRMAMFSSKSSSSLAASKKPPLKVKVFLPNGEGEGSSGGLKDRMAKYAETAGVAESDMSVVFKKKTAAASAKRKSFVPKKPKGDLQLRMQHYEGANNHESAKAIPGSDRKEQKKWKYQVNGAASSSAVIEMDKIKPLNLPEERGKGRISIYQTEMNKKQQHPTKEVTSPQELRMTDTNEEQRTALVASPKVPANNIKARLTMYQSNVVSPTNATVPEKDQPLELIPVGGLKGNTSKYHPKVVSPEPSEANHKRSSLPEQDEGNIKGRTANYQTNIVSSSLDAPEVNHNKNPMEVTLPKRAAGRGNLKGKLSEYQANSKLPYSTETNAQISTFVASNVSSINEKEAPGSTEYREKEGLSPSSCALETNQGSATPITSKTTNIEREEGENGLARPEEEPMLKEPVVESVVPALVSESTVVSLQEGFREKNLKDDEDGSLSPDDSQHGKPTSTEVPLPDAESQRKDIKDAKQDSPSSHVSELGHKLEEELKITLEEVPTPDAFHKEKLQEEDSSSNSTAPVENLADNLRAKIAKLVEAISADLSQKKKLEEEKRTHAERESLKAEMLLLSGALGASRDRIQTISVEVEQHEISAKKAEMELKSAAEVKKVKGSFLSKGKKKAKMEYEKALNFHQAKREQAKEAKGRLAAAQLKSEIAQRNVEECREKLERAHLDVCKRISPLSPSAVDAERIEHSLSQNKLEMERIELSLSQKKQEMERIELALSHIIPKETGEMNTSNLDPVTASLLSAEA